MAGVIDLKASLGIGRGDTRGANIIAGATVVVLAYLGIALRDYGELFWLNGILLLFVLGVRQRISLPSRITA